jgi:hypothetical protein
VNARDDRGHGSDGTAADRQLADEVRDALQTRDPQGTGEAAAGTGKSNPAVQRATARGRGLFGRRKT